MAGNTPLDLLKEVPIRPKNVFGEPVSFEELDVCDLDDETELGIGGEEAVRFRATDEGNQFVKKMIDPKLPSQKDVEEHKKLNFVSANGGRIEHYGERKVVLNTKSTF